jgi:uncharacterized integral membrane protein
MRFFSFLFLLVFAGVVGVFAWQNRQDVTLTFFQWSLTADMALILGGAFVAGMLAGWSVVAMVRRSFTRSAEWLEQQRRVAHAHP